MDISNKLLLWNFSLPEQYPNQLKTLPGSSDLSPLNPFFQAYIEVIVTYKDSDRRLIFMNSWKRLRKSKAYIILPEHDRHKCRMNVLSKMPSTTHIYSTTKRLMTVDMFQFGVPIEPHFIKLQWVCTESFVVERDLAGRKENGMALLEPAGTQLGILRDVSR